MPDSIVIADTKHKVDQLVAASTENADVEAYERLVEAWSLIVEENTAQLSLVSMQHQASWKRFQESFTARLIKAGEAGLTSGWNKQELTNLSGTLGGARHVSAATLIAERDEKQELQLEQRKAEEKVKVEGFISKLKGFLKN